MFDIGMFELFLIGVLALIVVGPRDLPKMLRTVAQMVRKVRAMGQEFQTSIKQIADEVELEEVTRKLNEAGNVPLDQVEPKPDILDEEDEKPAVGKTAEEKDKTASEPDTQTRLDLPEPTEKTGG